MAAGSTFGASLVVGLSTNIRISVAEDYTRSQTGSNTMNYGWFDAGASVLGAVSGEGIGHMIATSKQASKEAGILWNDANRAGKLANQRGRTAQHQKAEQLLNKADKYGSLESLLGGSAADQGVSGINWIFKQDKENK